MESTQRCIRISRCQTVRVRLHFRETIELLVEVLCATNKSSALKAIMVIGMYGQRLPRLFHGKVE
jgi:hypothetical protein